MTMEEFHRTGTHTVVRKDMTAVEARWKLCRTPVLAITPPRGLELRCYQARVKRHFKQQNIKARVQQNKQHNLVFIVRDE